MASIPKAKVGGPADGLPFASTVRAGDVVYTSGQVGIDPATGVTPSDLEDEIRQMFANLKSALASAGLDFRAVVKTTCLLTDMADLPAFNRIYSEEFAGHRPARSAFQVGLAENFRVEIEAIAVVR